MDGKVGQLMKNVCEHFGGLAKVGPPVHAVRLIIDLLKKKKMIQARRSFLVLLDLVHLKKK